MNPNDILGEVIEKGQSTVQKTGKTVADSATSAVKTAAGQLAGNSNQPGPNEANTTASDKQQTPSDKAKNDEFVKELYAPSKTQNVQNAQTDPQSQNADQAKLAGVRQKLHDEVYYQPLVNPPKPQEERPAEKVERQEMQELQEEKKKESEKPDFALQRQQRVAEIKGGGG